jgi:F0F1-type ATP synthase membrane subunit a
LEWCDQHPVAKISFIQLKGITGLTDDESPDCVKMQEEMLKAANDDCTGAMMQATLNHIMYIRKHGWDHYVKEMTKRKFKQKRYK